jgi:hypothetical protein
VGEFWIVLDNFLYFLFVSIFNFLHDFTNINQKKSLFEPKKFDNIKNVLSVSFHWKQEKREVCNHIIREFCGEIIVSY